MEGPNGLSRRFLFIVLRTSRHSAGVIEDAFGILIASTGSSFNRFRYCGEEWDANLGMYNLRARLMEPGRGRFWSSDTYDGDNKDPASLHKYLYCSGNPVDLCDASGHDSLAEEEESQADSAILEQGLADSFKAGLQALKAPAFECHLLCDPWPLPGHSAIFIKPFISLEGWLYEVLPEKGSGSLTRWFGSSDGVILKTIRNWRAVKSTYKWDYKVCNLSAIQFTAWMLGLNLINWIQINERTSQIPVKYGSLLSFIPFSTIQSCHAWALEAALGAYIISKA